MYEKSGQMAGMTASNIIVLIVGVGVGVLVLIFVGALGGQTYNLVEPDIQEIGNNIVTGEAFTANNVTPQVLSHGFIQSETVAIYNVSNNVVIGSGNFTFDYDQASVLLKGTASVVENGSSLAMNYTWGADDVRSSVGNSIVSGFTALETTGNYIPIIVLAVVIALVLTLVLSFTAIGRIQGGGSAL